MKWWERGTFFVRAITEDVPKEGSEPGLRGWAVTQQSGFMSLCFSHSWDISLLSVIDNVLKT